VLLAVTGATGSAVSTCCPLIASPSALIGFWMAANADHPAGPVHAAFIYNAPLFCGDLATEP
jgi:hypothetical protein